MFQKTRFSDNEIIISGDVAQIILCDNRGAEVSRATIDAEDADKVRGSKWRLDIKRKTSEATHYAATGRSPKIMLHRAVMGAKLGEIVDHVDGDGLNNRKENLRICNISENTANWHRLRSKYRGVYYHKATKKWAAEIYQQRKKYYIGLFGTPEDAARAYNQKAVELRGTAAKLNTIAGG